MVRLCWLHLVSKKVTDAGRYLVLLYIQELVVMKLSQLLDAPEVITIPRF